MKCIDEITVIIITASFQFASCSQFLNKQSKPYSPAASTKKSHPTASPQTKVFFILAQCMVEGGEAKSVI